MTKAKSARWSDVPLAASLARKAQILSAGWLLGIAYSLIEPWRFLLRDLVSFGALDFRLPPLVAITLLPAWGFWRLLKGPSLPALLPSVALSAIATWGMTETTLEQGGSAWILRSMEDLLMFAGLLASYGSLALFLVAARRLKSFTPVTLGNVFD